MASIWKLETEEAIPVVKRKGRIVAVITTNEDGSLRWDGFGMYRTNFKEGPDQMQRVFEDVKWFHRYQRGKPRLTLTFKSGRKEVYY